MIAKSKMHDKMFLKIIIAFVLGILYGVFFPDYLGPMEVLSTIFIRCIKMVVVPIIFFSLIAGMCSHANEEHGISRLFVKTIVYFEVMSLLAILVTFAAMLFFAPGVGIDTKSFPEMNISHYVAKVQGSSLKQFAYSIFPDNFFHAMTEDHLLAVIFLALISSVAILRIKNNERILGFVADANKFFFQIIHIIIGFSPIATFASIAYSVGRAGIDSLKNLGALVLVVLFSMAVFCVLIAVIASVVFRIPVFRLMSFLKQEMILAYATSSSESVFPQLLAKLQKFGCSKRIASFVLPMGYSFNLDGTAIYVTAGALFLQQAYQVTFSVHEYLMLFLVLLVTSKGAAGVTGAGFITLSATLAAIPETPIPLAGLSILLGIDRFMSDARTICNIVGNALGTLIIARSEGSLEIPSAEQLLADTDATTPTER